MDKILCQNVKFQTRDKTFSKLVSTDHNLLNTENTSEMCITRYQNFFHLTSKVSSSFHKNITFDVKYEISIRITSRTSMNFTLKKVNLLISAF